eukprot:88261-Pyramimonas_sp.AAC.1
MDWRGHVLPPPPSPRRRTGLKGARMCRARVSFTGTTSATSTRCEAHGLAVGLKCARTGELFTVIQAQDKKTSLM